MQREIHVHDGRRYHASCVYIRSKSGPLAPGMKPGTRTRLIKLGAFCSYCGLRSNALALRIQEQTMEKHIRGG